jgi:hypothetical protein
MDEIVTTAPQPTLFDDLAESVRSEAGPDTVETRQIETVDNDFATTLLGGLGI